MMRFLPFLCFALLGCGTSLPETPPPLADMEEPLALKKEPDDEAERQRLPLGGFTGAEVEPAFFEEPDEPGQEPDALRVARIVENSPAAAADLREGDLLLAVRVGEADSRTLRWPGQWRELEAEALPGTVLHLTVDRAGVERAAELTVVARVRPAGRRDAEMFREEQRGGIVVRTATEVEARRAGLGDGGGAVLIGLSAQSPWRRAGLRFGDVIVAVGDEPVQHPQVLLAALRTGEPKSDLRITYARDGAHHTVPVRLTERAQALRSIWIPPLYSYEADRDRWEMSFLLGFVAYESTPAAWRFDFLWIPVCSGGDADRLEVVR